MALDRQIHGDVTGIKDYVRDRIQALYTYDIPTGKLVTEELLYEMAQLTSMLNREVAVYLNRRGGVTAVSVGEASTAPLPEVKGRRGNTRLSGVRCVHTHPNGNWQLSPLDISALSIHRFDAMVAIGVTSAGGIDSAGIGLLIPEHGQLSGKSLIEGPYSLEHLVDMPYLVVVQAIERQLRDIPYTVEESGPERAILVGLDQPGAHRWDIEDSLDELAELAYTAGAEVCGRTVQKRNNPDPALFIGQGKLREIAMFCQEQQINLIIFDDELSPAQQRNIESFTGLKIIDRTALILDIFASRARTKEGKLQVELAQLKYLLPRLTGQGAELSRLGGGIGTRGPGETKLEVDRRRIRKRISDLENEIDQVSKHRQLHRKKRQDIPIPVVSLVGYTNAGKSTLLNTITQANVLAEDKLFATLDPTTRKVSLPGGRDILLTDTVGFIQKLPHHLVAAFRATLEEVVEADLLLHVIDISHPRMSEQSIAVYDVLRQLKAEDKSIISVLNKVDRIDSPPVIERLLREYPNSVAISALKNAGIDTLLALIEQHITRDSQVVIFHIPYQEGGVATQLREIGRIVDQKYLADVIEVVAEFNDQQYRKYQQFIVNMSEGAE